MVGIESYIVEIQFTLVRKRAVTIVNVFKKEAKRKYGEDHWYLRQFAITAIFIISANKYHKWLLCVLGGKLCTRHYFGKHGDVTANKMAAA